MANVSTSLNIRSGPGTNYETLTRVSSEKQMIRISKCIGTGELWDRVVLENGMVGYASQNYLKQAPIDQLILEFDKSLKVENNLITNIKENTVTQVKNKIHSNYEIEIENSKGEILKDDNLVGTGSRLKIISPQGRVVSEYKFIIYGDVNGDGKINSVDLLVLQRHLLEIDELTGEFYKAANTRKNEKNPSRFTTNTETCIRITGNRTIRR